MVNGHYEHNHKGPTCKNKWGFSYGNYKKIQDYMNGIGHNKEH